jgi:hypothetical protein
MFLFLIGYRANILLTVQIKKLFDNYFRSFTSATSSLASSVTVRVSAVGRCVLKNLTSLGTFNIPPLINSTSSALISLVVMFLVLIGYRANIMLTNRIKKLFNNYFRSFTIGQVTYPTLPIEGSRLLFHNFTIGQVTHPDATHRSG